MTTVAQAKGRKTTRRPAANQGEPRGVRGSFDQDDFEGAGPVDAFDADHFNV